MAKKYTQAEWARIQAKLPEEDRQPYSESPDKPEQKTAQDIAPDSYYIRNPATGLSPAQEEANKAVAEASAISGKQIVPGETGESNRVLTPYEMGSSTYLGKEYKTAAGAYTAAVKAAEKAGPPGDAPAGLHWNLQGTEWKLYDAEGKPFNYIGTATEDFAGDGTPGNPLTYKGKPFSGLRGGITYVNGVPKGSSGGANNGGGKVEVGRTTNPDGSTTITYTDGSTSVIPATSKTDGTLTTTPTGPLLAKDVFKSTMSLYFGQAELSKGWMDELYNVVSKFYRNGVDIPTAFNMALLDGRNNPNLKAFTDRFKGIYALQDLKQAGKPVNVPTIAEYVAAQEGMANIFNDVGLGDLATEEFTGDLIGKGNSVTTVAEKIAKVFQRIDMAPKAIKDTLSRYYPTVDRTTLAKTLLTGQKGVDQLVDELSQYDVLASAEQQGLGAINRIGGVDLARAQEYARRGETFSSLSPKFSKIARALPEVSKLSGISKVQDIGQVGLENALIGQSANELQQLEKLTSEEEARFSAKAGRAELPLASQRRANRAF